MNDLLKEIGNLTKEKEDSQKGWGINAHGNWCYPDTTPMSESEFNTELRGLINAYVKRLAKQAYESA